MFPLPPNLPSIGMLTVLACALGFGLLGWIGAVVGVLAVLAFFVWLEFRRMRRGERDEFQVHVDRTRDQPNSPIAPWISAPRAEDAAPGSPRLAWTADPLKALFDRIRAFSRETARACIP